MTVKQLMEMTIFPLYIMDGKQKYFISPWGLLYDTFGNCVVNEIQTDNDGNLEITLKTQLVRE